MRSRVDLTTSPCRSSSAKNVHLLRVNTERRKPKPSLKSFVRTFARLRADIFYTARDEHYKRVITIFTSLQSPQSVSSRANNSASSSPVEFPSLQVGQRFRINSSIGSAKGVRKNGTEKLHESRKSANEKVSRLIRRASVRT